MQLTQEVGRECTGYFQVTSLDTVKGVPGPGGSGALLQAEDQVVRYRADGVDPTADIGMMIAAGETIWFAGDLSKLRFIQGAATAILNITTFK
jgi:hypothetical protein